VRCLRSEQQHCEIAGVHGCAFGGAARKSCGHGFGHDDVPLGSLKGANADQRVGIDIVRRALQAPARQIFANAGADGSVIAGKLLEQGVASRGFDAQTGNYVDMVKAGIIDPTKVVRLALQGAASVAGLLITTEAMVTEAVEKEAGADF